ncbi:MAG: hypothetical protein KatS3mg022_3388 [Armatimonadota bacterium]|nr:MAG: hypothetical protein KatS3mg022_3388 [Armatimonadota bacterium]
MVVDAPRGTAETRITNVVKLMVVWVISLAVVALVLGVFYRARFTGPTDEAMDYGQIAYNLSKGRGFVTNNIVPLGLYFWKDVRKAYDIEHGPVYPVYLALLLYRGAQNSTLALGSMIWFVLSLVLVYFVGSRLFSRRVGYWAAAMLLFAEGALAWIAISGLPAAMAGFLLLAACYLLYRRSREELDPQSGQVIEVWEERTPRRSFWAGVLAGASYLTQLSLWLLLIPATVYLMITNPEHRRKHVVLFLLGFVLISLPYWIRNARLFGNPFFNLRVYEVGMATKPYPGYSLYRRYEEGKRPPKISTLFMENAQQVMGKWSRNLGNGIGALLTFPHPVITALAFAGLFIPVRQRALALWRNMVWWTAILVLVGCSFGVPGANVFALYCFAVPFSVLATGTLEDLIQALFENAEQVWRWAVAGVMLILFVPLVLTLVFREPKETREDLIAFSVISQRLDRTLSEMKQRNPQATLPTPIVGISDVPWRAAWYTHHIWVWLPETPLVQVPVELGQGRNKVTWNRSLPNISAAWDLLRKVQPQFAIMTPAVGGTPDGERLQGWVAHYNRARQFIFQSYFVADEKQMQQLAQAWKARRLTPYDPVLGGFYPVPEGRAGVVSRLEPPGWILFVLNR